MIIGPLSSAVHRWVRIGNNLDLNEGDDVRRFVEIFKEHGQRKVTKFVNNVEAQPLLHAFSADGTPLRVAKRESASVSTEKGDNVKTSRTQKSACEYLSLRSYWKHVDARGAHKLEVLPLDYRPLKKGKSQGYLYTACKSAAPLTTSIRPDGVNITSYCFDRGVFSSLGRLLLQRHAQWHDRQRRTAEVSGSSEVRAMAQRRFLLDWPMAIACANHDTHNAAQWSVSPLVPELESSLSSLHIAVESLRNSYDHIQGNLRGWLSKRVRFVDTSGVDDEEVATLWRALGVDEDWLPTYVLFKPVWRDGRLEVSDAVRDRKAVMEDLRSLCLHAYRFKKTSGSRWCTLGQSCRTIMASIQLGLRDLAASIRSGPNSNEYYLHGVDNLTPQLQRFVLVCALSSYVPDAAMTALYEDDRLLTYLDVFEASMDDAVEWLDSWDPPVWAALQQLLPPAGAEEPHFDLKTEVLAAALIARAFVHWRVLARAKAAPFPLCIGNIRYNVEKLKALDEAPTHPLSAKLWHLLRSGFSFRLDLMSDLDSIRLLI